MSKIELIATSAFGIESVVKQEIINLGYKNLKTEDGRITFEADEKAIARCNMWLRSADRVLLKIGQFKAESFEELFEKTKALRWENWIPKTGRFPVSKATSVKSKLFSKSDCQAIVKKAIVERLKETYRTKWFEESGANYPIYVNILKDRVTLSIDTSGSGLHKRGYREYANEAPLKETLAAALVQLSRWSPNRILADPLCGSGTILIEAAMIGNNIAPGLNRDFISEKWDNILPKKIWSNIREEAKENIHTNDFRLLGSDIDAKALKQARINAKLAGVDNLISFQKLSMQEFSSHKRYGVIITNPPYGERLSTNKEVEQLYIDMGNVFNKLKDWSYFILTGHLEFQKYFGHKANKNRKLYNGRLLTYFYQYYGALPPRGDRGTGN